VAHIQKRGPGRYKARYRGPDGHERSKTFTRKGDAERWLAAIEVEKSRAGWALTAHPVLVTPRRVAKTRPGHPRQAFPRCGNYY